MLCVEVLCHFFGTPRTKLAEDRRCKHKDTESCNTNMAVIIVTDYACGILAELVLTEDDQ